MFAETRAVSSRRGGTGSENVGLAILAWGTVADQRRLAMLLEAVRQLAAATGLAVDLAAASGGAACPIRSLKRPRSLQLRRPLKRCGGW